MLPPLTAFCFKLTGQLGGCECATASLARGVSAEDFARYEAVVARTLSQTNVPRRRAWREALQQEADTRSVTANLLESLVLETSREHHLAVKACGAG
ncbi:MAG: hypothetical protein AAF493_27870 [Pseudomonadota bacterium]